MKTLNRILVVDDSAPTREIIQRNLLQKGYQVFTSADAYNAIQIINSIRIDLVITDLKMPKINGIDLIKFIRENHQECEVIMMTGYPSIETAVEVIKIGADNYLTKPFTDDELFQSVEKAFEKIKIKRHYQNFKMDNFGKKFKILGESKQIKHVFQQIQKASLSASTVLIYGESGTGKELVARAVHYHSKRATFPFIPINCSAIPESLLESELFGYKKGAFTGAYENRTGFFQAAEGGTIFLDEISETSPAIQIKLMRILENKEVFMLGSKQSKKVNVRIIVATNKNLQQLIKQKLFREDLFYRLNVLNINLPPLREREGDIGFLIHYFSAYYAKESGKHTPTFTSRALSALERYLWPGNVRELENLIQRLIVMTDHNEIDISDLPNYMRFQPTFQANLNRSLEEVELEYIKNVLSSVQGNKTHAAKILKIDRKTLRQKLKKDDLTE